MTSSANSSLPWLMLDLGSTNIKGALLGPAGELLHSASHPNRPHTTAEGVQEQNVEDWWQAAVAVIRELSQHSTDLAGIGVTGQMQNLILLDAHQRPLRPVISYNDQRADRIVDSWRQNQQLQRLLDETGNEQGPTSLLGKLRWLQDQTPEVLSRTEQIFVGSADYLVFRLTGVALADTTTAATTGLMALEPRTWHQQLLAAVGVGAQVSKLPKLVSGGTLASRLLPALADELGLRGDIPVYLGPGDAGATTIGAGCGGTGKAYAYLGTSGWVGLTEGVPASMESGVFTLAHPDPQHYLQVAPILTAGGNLSWVKELFQWESYEELIACALACPPGRLLYLPYLQGERSPFIDPHARGTWIGMTSQTQPAELTRAVLEGTCLAFRHALQAIAMQPPAELFLTGGVSRSETFCQLFADVLGLPIHLIADPEWTGLRGVWACCRGETTTYSPGVKKTFDPDPQLRAHYERMFELFLQSYPALRELFGQLQRR